MQNRTSKSQVCQLTVESFVHNIWKQIVGTKSDSKNTFFDKFFFVAAGPGIIKLITAVIYDFRNKLTLDKAGKACQGQTL